MKVQVFCGDCATDDEAVEMTVSGQLAHNIEEEIQSQMYECPECNKVVTVVIQLP